MTAPSAAPPHLLARNLSFVRARAALEAGRLALLFDEQSGHGDLIARADRITPQAINLMTVAARGLVCVAVPAARVERLALRPMASGWQTPAKAFTVSVEARRGVDTGISARDRAVTIRALVAPEAVADDLVSPGHVFPLRARPPGEGAPGRTEIALALVAAAGGPDGAVLCEALDERGDLAGLTDLEALARAHEIPIVGFTAVVAACARTLGEPAALFPPLSHRQPWQEALHLARNEESPWR